ncbi:MAG: hypothetical protein ACLFQR_06360 [Desulfovibrionales bacterium]
MILEDRAGNTWRVTAGDDKMRLHLLDKVAVCQALDLTAEELCAYYGSGPDERERFRDQLGRNIGFPLWPLFVQESFEAELEHLRRFGAFGRGEGDSILEEDLYDLIVPMSYDEALQKNESLRPDTEELSAYARDKVVFEEEVKSQAVCTVTLPRDVIEDNEETARLLESRAEDIQCCVVCCSPAQAVGVLETEDGAGMVLHGMCAECRPLSQDEQEKIESLKAAVRGRVEKKG